MDVFEALYTARAMRRMRPDPTPYAVQARILDAAIRAPMPGGQQAWRFVLVDFTRNPAGAPGASFAGARVVGYSLMVRPKSWRSTCRPRS